VIELLSEKNPNSRLFIDVIRSVCREVGEQSMQISKLVDERNEMNARMLVFEKIMEQAQDNERVTNESIREHIEELQKYVEDREMKIKSYEEKVGEVDYLSSLVTKYVNVPTVA
jgi:chromosome segregation ATPase